MYHDYTLKDSLYLLTAQQHYRKLNFPTIIHYTYRYLIC